MAWSLKFFQSTDCPVQSKTLIKSRHLHADKIIEIVHQAAFYQFFFDILQVLNDADFGL